MGHMPVATAGGANVTHAWRHWCHTRARQQQRQPWYDTRLWWPQAVPMWHTPG